jgi:ABC-type cobalamin transport system ATPase subunit
VDAELPPWEALTLLAHVERCTACRDLVAREVALRDAIRRALRDVTMPPWLLARVSAALAVLDADPDEEPCR